MGVSELREAVARPIRPPIRRPVPVPNVMVTAGAKGALYHVIGAHLDGRRRGHHPIPVLRVSAPEIVKLWGGAPVFLPCRMENRFLPDLHELKAMAGPATRGIVLNSRAIPPAP